MDRKKNPKFPSIVSASIDLKSLPPSRTEVKKIIKDSGISVTRIAEHMGVNRQALDYNLLGDKRINPEVYVAITKAINEISFDASQTMKRKIGVFDKAEMDKRLEYIKEHVFPILKQLKLINGELDMSDNISGFTFFPYNVESCFCVINKGDQMSDDSSSQSILDEDCLLIDMKQKIISGDIVLVKLATDRELVRQVIINQDKSYTLHCLNSKYPDLNLSQSDILYMGKVCAKHSKVTWL